MSTETSKILAKLKEKRRESNANSGQLRQIPTDEYSHKFGLITNQESRKIDNFEEFLSKELAIANIDDDRLLQLKAAHMRLVQIPLLQMKEECKDPKLQVVLDDLFNWFHIAFISELKMTRAKKGMERRLQARIDSEMNKEESGGFRIPRLRPSEQQQGDVLYD